jgi:hypothetical protein
VVRDLTRRLRGGDFRQAVKAVAELRHLDCASGAHVISLITPGDEQRAFQLLVARLVVDGGVHELAARWNDLPSPQWREMLVSEIGQAIHLWVDEGTIELLLAALDDPEVARQAVESLIECLTWPDKYIELLGHSANRSDQRAVALLEQFRAMAGETRRAEFEALDPYNLPFPTSILATKKGIPPGTPFVRIWSRPTGLLDLNGLEKAIERIRCREG